MKQVDCGLFPLCIFLLKQLT